MIDIGLTNALAQIRDALYEISDTLKDAKEAEDISNKCENCPGCCATVGEVFAQYQQKHQRKNAKSNTKFQPGIKMQSVN